MNSKGWKICKMGEVCDVRDGTHDSPKQSQEGYYLVTSKHIKNGTLNLSSAYKISPDDFVKINKRSKVDKWDILFSMIGTVGETLLINFNPHFAIKNVGLFKTNDEHLARWIYYYLKSPDAQNEIKASQKGTTQQYISLTDLRNFPIILPPSEIYKTIGEILSSLDDAIELNNQANKTLEEIAKAIFKEWFVDYRFPNSTGEMQETEMGNIPVGWQVDGLGEITFVQNGFAFRSNDFKEDGEIGIIKIKNISNNFVDVESTDFVDNEVVELLDKKFKIEIGSLLIAMTGAEVGKIGLVPVTEKALWLNQRVGKFVEKVKYGNYFLFLLLSSNEYQSKIFNSALGSAQPNISATTIENIPIIVPPHDLIIQFGEIVAPLFEQILQNVSENKTLASIRDLLLPKLMKGEIEVSI